MQLASPLFRSLALAKALIPVSNPHKWTILIVAGAFLSGVTTSFAAEIQTSGVIGSAGATTTINGKQLPPPDPKFSGTIKLKASESKGWWAPRVVPPKSAPNVLLIMTDDVGFAAPSTFGGVIPTPALGSHCEKRITLHQFPLHIPVLPHAFLNHHRTQSSYKRLWRGG